MRFYTKEQALHKVAALCSKAEKCVFDVENKLTQWEISQSEIDGIVDYLIKEKFLDEERFVRYYIKDKLTFNGWGKQKVRFQLQQKRVDMTLFQQLWEEIDQDQYQEQLLYLLQKKRKSIKDTDPWAVKQKLLRYAAGRGFQMDEIYSALDALAAGADDDSSGAL